MDQELRHKDTWSGMHKGINFEIACWSYNDSHSIKDTVDLRTVWNSYIILPIDMFPEESHKDLWLEPDISKYGYVYYNYCNDLINSVDFHGGCTYYNKTHGMDGGRKVIKIGCDYNHLRDQHMDYDIDHIHHGIKRAIESLPSNLKHRCINNGNFYHVEDGYILRDDTFYSFEGITQNAEWKRDNK